MIRILILATSLLMTGCLEPALTNGSNATSDGGQDLDLADAHRDQSLTTDTDILADTGLTDTDVAPTDTDTTDTGCGVGEVASGSECVCDVANGFTQCEDPMGCRKLGDCVDILGDGVDSNHDGADGYTALTVFVSKDRGDDGNDGYLPTTPVKSLERAEEVRKDTQRTTILVAGGEYIAPQGWIVDNPIFTIWGGYTDDFINHPEADKTMIKNTSGGPTLTVLNGTLINLRMITLQSPQNPTKHAITLRVENSLVDFFGVRVVRGVGNEGEDGIQGVKGNDGGDTTTATAGRIMCHGTIVTGGAGGNGGSCPLKPNGQEIFPMQGGHGTNGLGNFFNTGGGMSGANHCAYKNFSHGAAGEHRTTIGTSGVPGEPSPITGAVINGNWTNGERANDGAYGNNGSSGAGGGGGGAIIGLDGGVGGGGGSGGCGGAPGTGGEHGGDSIGILALGTSALTGAVAVGGGDGGDGGDGKDGAEGGRGGSGGSGVTPQHNGVDGSRGGDGGNGGDGGRSGAGAGGNGGSIYGVAHGPQVQTHSLTLIAGQGDPGQPGTSPDPQGAGKPGETVSKIEIVEH